jgi:hypothetical protein
MIDMKRKNAVLVTEDDLLLDLAFHNVAPSLLIEFSEKIGRHCYGGNLTAAISDLFGKALCEQDFCEIPHSSSSKKRSAAENSISEYERVKIDSSLFIQRKKNE